VGQHEFESVNVKSKMYDSKINTKPLAYILTPKTTILLFLKNITLYGNTFLVYPWLGRNG